MRKLTPIPGYPDHLTHQLHPYPAKLIAHIPRWLLSDSSWNDASGLLFDPFCGSGTVLLEGALQHRTLVGADINPLARLITRAKVATPDAGEFDEAVRRVVQRAIRERAPVDVPHVVNLRHWYSERSIRELGQLRASILRETGAPVMDLLWTSFSRVVRMKSRADPRISVPVRIHSMRGSDEHPLATEARARAQRMGRTPAAKLFETAAADASRRIRALLDFASCRFEAPTLLLDARALNMPARSIGTVITSPPYATAQKYIRAGSLSAGWLGLATPDELKELTKCSIGHERLRKAEWQATLADAPRFAMPFLSRIRRASLERAAITAKYFLEMEAFWTALLPKLRKHAGVAFVVGDNTIAGHRFDAARFHKRIASEHGLLLRAELRDRIRGRALLTDRRGKSNAIVHETILIWQREPA